MDVCKAQELGYKVNPELIRTLEKALGAVKDSTELVIASPEGAKQSKGKIASSLDKLGTKP
jgi:hypothetical protein